MRLVSLVLLGVLAVATAFSQGGLQSFPTAVDSSNVVDNPGLEDWTAGTPDHWTLTGGGTPIFTQDATTYHGGASSIKITGASSCSVGWRSRPLICPCPRGSTR